MPPDCSAWDSFIELKAEQVAALKELVKKFLLQVRQCTLKIWNLILFYTREVGELWRVM